jgi:ADP-ribose pyrophosphatase YjhB (NUDIX family)
MKLIDPMQKPPAIEVIARALIIDTEAEKVLLCSTKDKSRYYLPGGHIEFGEPVHFGLSREIWEEMGVETSAEKFSFLGGSENIFMQENERMHEINLFFRVPIGISSHKEIVSREEHIEFSWVSVADLAMIPILPESLGGMIKEWTKGKPQILWHDL